MTNYVWTIIAIGVLASAGVLGAVALYLFGDQAQAATVIGLAFAFLTPTLASLLTLARAHETGQAVTQLHLQVNSRLDQLLTATHTAGVAEGRSQRVLEEKPPC